MTAGRHESPEERADRNWNDLLQELRVTETGVQVLFSLLLTLPFTNRFGQVTAFQRVVYFVALLLAAASSVALIAPAANHRVLFQQGQKPRVVQQSSRYALAGLVLLVLAVTAVLLLISDVLFGTGPAVVVAAGFGLGTTWLWFGRPLLHRASKRS